MPGKKPTNSKAEAGRARKAEQAALKAEQEAKKAEEREAQEWQKGSNVRGQARSEAAGKVVRSQQALLRVFMRDMRLNEFV